MRKMLKCWVTVLLVSLSVAEGWPAFQARIPNGDRVMRNGVLWPAVGHDLSHPSGSEDGSRNPFGRDFDAQGKKWTETLCKTDSDGDGQSNGMELGDPNCTWSSSSSTPPARTEDVSHPGFSDSTTTSGSSKIDLGGGVGESDPKKALFEASGHEATEEDDGGAGAQIADFLRDGPSNPNCSKKGSAAISEGDQCPGLCYTSFADDEKWLWCFIVLVVMVLYNAWYFLYKRRGEGLFSRVAAQWAETIVSLRPKDAKQPVTAIQTMRCSLQATQAFSAVSGVIAGYCLLVEESDRHNRIIYMYMSIMNWLASIFFLEQMRCFYHLAYCVVRTQPLDPNLIPPQFLQLLADLRTGQIEESELRRDWIGKSLRDKKKGNQESLCKYLENEERLPYLFLSGGSDKSVAGGSDSEFAYQMALETFMPPVDEEERVRLLLDRAFTYFSLGQRAFLSGIPIIFGLMHDYWMGVATAFLIAFHVFYYDNLLDEDGGSWESMCCVQFYKRFLSGRASSERSDRVDTTSGLEANPPVSENQTNSAMPQETQNTTSSHTKEDTADPLEVSS